MSKRKITTITGTGYRGTARTATVYFDSDLEEYSVVFRIDNVKQQDATYYTDSESDAIGTARLWVRGGK